MDVLPKLWSFSKDDVFRANVSYENGNEEDQMCPTRKNRWVFPTSTRLERKTKMVRALECFFVTTTAWNLPNTSSSALNIS